MSKRLGLVRAHKNALLCMEEVCKELGEEFRERMTASHYVKEFRTVFIGVPRRSGKTTFICDIAGPDDLIIVPRVSMLPIVWENRPKARVAAKPIPLPKLYKNLVRGTLYIDEPWLLEESLGDTLDAVNTFMVIEKVIGIGTPS